MKPSLPKFAGKALLLFTVCFSLLSKSNAQAFIFGNEKIKWEVGVNFGPSFFLGDLGGNAGKGTNNLKDLNLEFTKLMKGAYITMYPNKWVGLRLAASLTYLEGDDATINTTGINELWRKQRNLDFRTNVTEVNGSIEVFPTMIFAADPDNEPRLRPYGLIGAGIYHFNPQGSIKASNGDKSWYYLQPLRTEGEGMAEYPYSKPYKLTQLNVLYGGGLKYFLSDRVNIGAEFLYRKTFTDYLDDVSKKYIDPKNFAKYLPSQTASLATKLSDKAIGIIYPGMTRYPEGTQRGDLKNADTYFSVVLKVGFRLGPIYESSFARRAARQTRCPSVY
ncbi:hypothetical protein [Ferruginibacter sp. SUN106]|uniref:hypothetical protein n=1 Tax=Ferruginibacter sp. SUN106 TaxID=2978348 RepID=UPI003D35A261